jgi:hypothetical protein
MAGWWTGTWGTLLVVLGRGATTLASSAHATCTEGHTTPFNPALIGYVYTPTFVCQSNAMTIIACLHHKFAHLSLSLLRSFWKYRLPSMEIAFSMRLLSVSTLTHWRTEGRRVRGTVSEVQWRPRTCLYFARPCMHCSNGHCMTHARTLHLQEEIACVKQPACGLRAFGTHDPRSSALSLEWTSHLWPMPHSPLHVRHYSKPTHTHSRMHAS